MKLQRVRFVFASRQMSW